MHWIRQRTLAFLSPQGFVVASDVPWRQSEDEQQWRLRPIEEIARQLLALDAVFTWVTVPEDGLSTDDMNMYMQILDLKRHLSASELEIVNSDRTVAHNDNIGTIGWLLESMWGLAWVLGFEPGLSLVGFIDNKTSTAMREEFIPRPRGPIEDLLAKATLRPVDRVVTIDDMFTCILNAARNAHQGRRRTVPPQFDPMVDGEILYVRRQALTWCLSPGVSWDDTDQSF